MGPEQPGGAMVQTQRVINLDGSNQIKCKKKKKREQKVPNFDEIRVDHKDQTVKPRN